MKRPALAVLALGLYLTIRGYHSRDGDQSYRLPLLLNRQDAATFAGDPFVRAVDAFNPHRGYLAILDVTSRPFGLSVALFALFAATFVVTCLAIDRIARRIWPEAPDSVGMLAVAMVLATKAGNIGTNHLFEAMLLDRLIAFALGWVALAEILDDPRRGKWTGAAALGVAALIHPSLGLQLAMLAAAGWAAWPLVRGSGVSPRTAMAALMVLIPAMLPAMVLMGRSGARLFDGMTPADFLRISASVQSPQHMLPHLWRMPQWLAWLAHPLLAGLAVASAGRPAFRGTRGRLLVLLILNLIGLAAAWVAIEPLGNRFATTFQPFRMATVARGLCLMLMAERVRSLWMRGDDGGRLRAVLIFAGLGGDWAMVVVAMVELSASAARIFGRRLETCVAMAVLGVGLVFLARHDTESGHVRLLAAIGVAATASIAGRFRGVWSWNRRRIAAFGVAAWLVPVAAMIAPLVASEGAARPLLATWRFGEYASDDVERLAVWCRDHTPTHARFITPPGPKTFRLWSRREVAFNRAASPYHAAGLADWLARFQDHVDFRGTVDDFAAAYLRDRQALERRYQEMSHADRAALASRQGAGYVIAAPSDDPGPLTLLHVEGRYAAYKVPTSIASAR